MAQRHIHIIGAGMAGLSAALQLALAGEKVTLYEAAPFAGGRCRSFLDRDLDCRIDNGNHLVLSGNAAIHDYLDLTGARESMSDPGAALFPFMDLESGERWTVQMNDGLFPRWIFDKGRRIAGTKPLDYLSALNILTAGPGDTVAARLDTNSFIYKRFWEPLTIGALNTEPEIASAQLLSGILRQTFLAGGRACVPLVPKVGLSETFVIPCLNVLRQRGVEVKYTHRLRSLLIEDYRAKELHFSNVGTIELGRDDWVVLALPAWVVKDLLPEIPVPDDFRSIINAHFRIEAPRNPAGFTGVVGGIAEWVFVRDGIVSVTVSAGERHDDMPVRDLAALVWQDVARLHDLDPAKLPPHRIFKEKYATFAATPAQNAKRPYSYIGMHNMALAGEWTATGLPSTIEGAIRSGLKAAQMVMRWGD